jgi:Tol biopolymer transport system component
MRKRVVAVGIVGGLVAAGAFALLEHHRPPPPPEGTIAYSGPDFQDVLVARGDGSGARRLTSAPGPQFDPSFSPDGSLIAYRDSRRGINKDDEIWVMDRDGGHARNLTHDHANDWSPAWSPDGTTIAFASTRSGSLELWTMASDGSNPRRLSRSPAEYPSWSPDGSRIAFSLVTAGAVIARRQRLMIMRADGSRVRSLGLSGSLPAWTS